MAHPEPVLLIDKRVGSGELAKYMSILHLPVEVCDLSYGDMSFLGLGEDGMPIPIGIERKALPDFLSSMYTGRFQSHQLPGLLQCYKEVWVVVEGLWKVDPHSGQVWVPKGKHWGPLNLSGKDVLYHDLESMFLTLEIKGGVRLRRTTGKLETGRFIRTLYEWWTSKDFADHRSHLRFRTLDADSALLVRPSLMREWAARLPGIGWSKSVVGDQFENPIALALADETEWANRTWTDKLGKVKKIGPAIASKIGHALRTENSCSSLSYEPLPQTHPGDRPGPTPSVDRPDQSRWGQPDPVGRDLRRECRCSA